MLVVEGTDAERQRQRATGEQCGYVRHAWRSRLVADSRFNEEGTLAITALIGGGWVVLKRDAQFRATTSEVGGTPAVTATGDGGLVVSWTGSASNPGDEGAYVRKYDAASVAVGTKVSVDSGPTAFVGTPTNVAPTDISLDDSFIAEGAVAGSKIGKLTVTDPDTSRSNWWLIDNAGWRGLGRRVEYLFGNARILVERTDLCCERAAGGRRNLVPRRLRLLARFAGTESDRRWWICRHVDFRTKHPPTGVPRRRNKVRRCRRGQRGYRV